MVGSEEYKPTIVLITCQVMYSGITLTGRAALLQNMNSMVFVVYRQCIAFLIIAPIAYFKRRGKKTCDLGWNNFWWISLLSFVGITINQNMFFSGVYLASSSAASALLNLVPAITFIVAYSMGLEKVDIRSWRSAAKIIGTLSCVAAAVAMAFLKGPKLLNVNFFNQGGDHDTWLLGCFLLFGSSCCWSIWLTLLARVSASYPDHLSLTAWMFFNAAWQSGILTLIVEPKIHIWKLNTSLELICCLCAGTVSSITFFAQAWCTSRRGPLFSAMFNPLGTVIVTFFAAVFLHEELYTGSLVGAIAVIIGLYTVLWGKAKDYHDKMKEEEETLPISETTDAATLYDDRSRKIDLKDPLLPEKSTNF